MKRFKKIFFATDFSTCGYHAQRYAFALAKRFGAEIHIGHVVDTAYSSYAGVYGFGAVVDLHVDEIKKHAQEGLVSVTDAARADGIDAHPHLLSGRPPEEIVERALYSGCDLIVIGTHGRSGFDHFLFGSTCERVVRYSAVPVLAVKSPEKEFVDRKGAVEIGRVLCPCDLSETSEQAVSLAADVCRIFDAELLLLHVIDSRIEYPMLLPEAVLPTGAELHDHAVKRLEALAGKSGDISSQIEVVTGVPYREIGEYAKKENVDLVVMTTHGRRGVPLALIGSTAEKIVRTVPVPVLSVRPVQAARDREVEEEAGLKAVSTPT